MFSGRVAMANPTTGIDFFCKISSQHWNFEQLYSAYNSNPKRYMQDHVSAAIQLHAIFYQNTYDSTDSEVVSEIAKSEGLLKAFCLARFVELRKYGVEGVESLRSVIEDVYKYAEQWEDAEFLRSVSKYSMDMIPSAYLEHDYVEVCERCHADPNYALSRYQARQQALPRRPTPKSGNDFHLSTYYRRKHDIVNYCWTRLAELCFFTGQGLEEGMQQIQKEVAGRSRWHNDEFRATMPAPSGPFSILSSIRSKAQSVLTHLRWSYQQNPAYLRQAISWEYRFLLWSLLFAIVLWALAYVLDWVYYTAWECVAYHVPIFGTVFQHWFGPAKPPSWGFKCLRSMFSDTPAPIYDSDPEWNKDFLSFMNQTLDLAKIGMTEVALVPMITTSRYNLEYASKYISASPKIPKSDRKRIERELEALIETTRDLGQHCKKYENMVEILLANLELHLETTLHKVSSIVNLTIKLNRQLPRWVEYLIEVGADLCLGSITQSRPVVVLYCLITISVDYILNCQYTEQDEHCVRYNSINLDEDIASRLNFVDNGSGGYNLSQISAEWGYLFAVVKADITELQIKAAQGEEMINSIERGFRKVQPLAWRVYENAGRKGKYLAEDPWPCGWGLDAWCKSNKLKAIMEKEDWKKIRSDIQNSMQAYSWAKVHFESTAHILENMDRQVDRMRRKTDSFHLWTKGNSDAASLRDWLIVKKLLSKDLRPILQLLNAARRRVATKERI
ncbi:hypothetical protein B0O99DRAFT_310311 [Bisporella sp. PMI_857]|nr:hypothetical protein B0O99DRAFT_310311 [Bisporella sp. PMI_857]